MITCINVTDKNKTVLRVLSLEVLKPALLSHRDSSVRLKTHGEEDDGASLVIACSDFQILVSPKRFEIDASNFPFPLIHTLLHHSSNLQQTSKVESPSAHLG